LAAAAGWLLRAGDASPQNYGKYHDRPVCCWTWLQQSGIGFTCDTATPPPSRLAVMQALISFPV
jgi:hypothetical protein